MAGVTRSCSPAVMISRRESTVCSDAAVLASDSSAMKGRNTRSMRSRAMSSTSAKGSRRVSSLTSTSVPPVLHVLKISWNETSKLSDANWRVRVPTVASDVVRCHSSRLTSAACPMATPFGTPVEPEV